MEKEVLHVIREQLKNENLPKYRKHQLASIEKYLSGQSTSTIANELQVTPRSIQRYIRSYRENGLASILESSKPGNKNKLSEEKEKKIKQDIQNEPTVYGYLVPEWTSRLLRKYITKEYKITLSEESCRKIIDSAGVKKEKQSLYKQRKQFEEQLSIYLNDSDTEVWALSDIYLGIRERRKNKQGKVPYYPKELLKDSSEMLKMELTENIKVDLTQKAKEEWVLCLKSVKSNSFFYWHHTDRHEELSRYKEAIQAMVKHTKHAQIVLIMPNTAIHRRNFLKIHIKKSKKEISVNYFPPQSPDLNPLYELKEYLLETFQLKKKKTHERKILSSQKVKQILNYLDQISYHEK